MFVQFALDHFFGCLDNQRGAFRIEQSEIVICLGCSPLNQAESANEGTRKPVAAHREIQDRALSGSSIKRGFGERHFAHRILFHPRPPAGHARVAEVRLSCSDRSASPLRPLALSKTVMNIGGIFCRKYSDSACSKILACCFSSLVT